MQQVAVVTGAGSGIGQACALALLERDWHVALIGRREAALRETADRSGPNGDRALVLPCDIGDQQAIQAIADAIVARLGRVDALVNAAGTNIPERSLAKLNVDDYQALINTNLNGAFYCAHAFLPHMRSQHSGTIVNISSVAGLRASKVAGVAYVMSKFGVNGLTESINIEERANGIRACVICPGEVNTPILDLRPSPPPP
ncbi:MAG TPA: SDR family oxidoreductase, partial [Roseiflexaceae bacterium]|nr:SDR family oxidoreductase [Roseiflexaceae bacterium]